ncbi:MAG: hypothetical protein NTX00_00890 [Candidatus Parcubacteria bacterium]|nr:hypothetical protein [Candidatus Parcubacteria bacterium]
MPNGNPIAVIILIVIVLIFLILIFNDILFNNIKSLFSELAKSLSGIIEDLVIFQKYLLEIKELITEKKPLDLQILQKVMLYLADEGIAETPVMAFQQKHINDDNYKIIIDTSHVQLMLEIIAKYIERDLKTDFPETAYNIKEEPEAIVINYGKILKEYFTAANKLLGK